MTLQELKEKFASTMGAAQQTKELFDSAIVGGVDRETLANDIFFLY